MALASMTSMVPIVPGKEDTNRQAFGRFAGPERGDFAAWGARHGIDRYAVWHQQTPLGSVALVFDRRFRDLVREVHGVELASDARVPPRAGGRRLARSRVVTPRA